MKDLILQHWQLIVGYLAVGWLLGAVLFRGVFITKGCSMGGNSGGQPLFYYRVDMPTMPQAIMYVIGMLLWPLTLVAIAIVGFIGLGAYIMESKNQVFPRIVKWVFGWPLLLIFGLCGGNSVDHCD